MSSTNRGAVRQEHDYYATPEEEIRLFLRAWLDDCPEVLALLRDGGRVLDPCAGGNTQAIQWEGLNIPPTRMAYPHALREVLRGHTEVIYDTNDIRLDSPADTHHDFLDGDTKGLWPVPDLVITNPPFSFAMEIIQQALRTVVPGGWVVMLLRLNFFGSDKRFDFFKTNPPQRAYVHHKRMSFRPDGKTDSIEYAHMVWRASPCAVSKSISPPTTILRVI